MSLYCPLKEYKNENHGILLREIIGKLGKKACFVGDEAGYFFCTSRGTNAPSISFSNKRTFIFYSLLRDDVYIMREAFDAYMKHYEPKG